MKTNVDLKAIIKEVSIWRKKKTTKNSKIPDQLASAIKELSEHYKPGQIAGLLEMSHSTVHKIIGKDQKKTQFIEMPSLEPYPKGSFLCTLQRADGAKLSIGVEKGQINVLMETFLCSK